MLGRTIVLGMFRAPHVDVRQYCIEIELMYTFSDFAT